MKILTSVKKNALGVMEAAAKTALATSANTTSSIWIGQPKAPAELKKFSKIEK